MAAKPEPTFTAAPVKIGDDKVEDAGPTGTAVPVPPDGPGPGATGDVITEVVTTGMVKTPEVV